MATKKQGSQEMVGLTDNIIYKLPDEILEQIFCYLPIRDAVRTSVLSQKWRYGWTKFNQLNLYFDGATEEEMLENKDGSYFRMVGSVLSSYVGPIHKCVLKSVWYDPEGNMNALLQLLSIKGIKDLTIDGFELPPSIFQCLGLKRLSLGFCALPNSTAFKGFPDLVRLDLDYVHAYGDILEKVIVNSPLEMLYMDSCSFYPTETVSSLRETAISAPNLRVLDIVTGSRGLHHSQMITQNLRVASFRIENGRRISVNMESNCYYILRSMPKIEVLTFDCRLHKTSALDIIPNKLPESLQNLKTVTLCYMDALSVDQISFMFCIFRNSPTLQNLNIHTNDNFERYNAQVGNDSSKAAMGYLDVQAKEEVKTSITTLSVTFLGVNYAKHIEEWIALLDSIVSCCPALGELVIKVHQYPWIQDFVKLQLSSALRRYQLSSIKLKIIYSNAYWAADAS